MDTRNTKALQRIEEKIRAASSDPLRLHVLENAKSFKTSWIDLGRSLYSVWKDKRYKEWGFATFDAYTAGEIGIRKQTSMKLLRSYFFLEKEEPDYLHDEYRKQLEAPAIPSYESIDVLRLAKNKKELDSGDYAHLKQAIFQKGKDAREVKKDLTQLIRQRQELEPEEAWEKKRATAVKRMVSVLKSLKEEVKGSKLISAGLVRETENLIKKLEAEIA